MTNKSLLRSTRASPSARSAKGEAPLPTSPPVVVSASHAKKIINSLAKLYPNPASELTFRNEFELVCAVLLSAQCTDKKVNQVTPILFARFPSFKALAEAQVAEVENIIRPINYYKTKSKNLVAMARKVLEEFEGRLPHQQSLLTSLPGVGQKTANVILCEQGETPAFPVDTHVFRLAHRLGLSSGKTPELVEEDLKRTFPPRSWRDLHHQLIFHGRRVCKALRPLCDQCSLVKECHFFSVLHERN